MRFIIIILFLFPAFLSAQVITFKIEGSIIDSTNAKYAYLVGPSKKDTLFKNVKIVEGSFLFNDSCDLDKEFFRYGFIFFDDRPNVSLAEIASKLKTRIWLVGASNELRYIVLEDIKLSFQKAADAKNAKIMKDGIFAKQIEELNKMRKSYTTSEFIKQHPDSPVSLYCLIGNVNFYEAPVEKSALEEMWGNPKELFEILSDRLKNSVLGKELKLKIAKYYN
ncbi:hypothetical protein ACS5PU_10440 [Pedobacter sp. GSP4]|uniref:hypothetical protein n=1 Tax=Pedobacter sp. GSP4 TaxID=3453716 RepID=UPI003EF06631